MFKMSLRLLLSLAFALPLLVPTNVRADVIGDLYRCQVNATRSHAWTPIQVSVSF